jgi:phage shock protein E
MKTKISGLLVILFIISAFTSPESKIIDSKEANKMLAGKTRYVILDVRTTDEFNSGHIKGAVNIDITKSDAHAKIDRLDHKAKYIVHCRTKNRSQVAVDYMISNGFTEVYKMQDGITGWIANGFPVK